MRPGALKPIVIEMKRAAGHNKTHVSGLESFCISPDAVAQALKVKLGCTTAVLKLPGNNVKDMEVLLQGHCVTEVCDYLRDVYCIDKSNKQWIEVRAPPPAADRTKLKRGIEVIGHPTPPYRGDLSRLFVPALCCVPVLRYSCSAC